MYSKAVRYLKEEPWLTDLADLATVIDGWEAILADNPDAPSWARYAAGQQIEAARRERAFLGSLVG